MKSVYAGAPVELLFIVLNVTLVNPVLSSVLDVTSLQCEHETIFLFPTTVVGDGILSDPPIVICVHSASTKLPPVADDFIS